MKTTALALLAGSMICGATSVAQPAALAAAPANMPPSFFEQAGWLGQKYFGSGEYAKLETLVADLVKSGARNEDGRFELFMLTFKLEDWLELWAEDNDATMDSKLAAWHEQFPASALQPIVAAMQIHATAWRARGKGFASTVTEEGWRMFAERNQRAWQMLMDHKKESSAVPTWYEQAIKIGIDVGIPDESVRKLFDEGVHRYPGYHAIYFTYARQLSPRWGGSYAAADAFINEQTAAKTNPEGEILYARLYWLIDQYEDGSPSFFEDSLVSWPKMRRGFQRLMLEYPNSKWNQVNFAIFACRARDATTYATLRSKVKAGEFDATAPEGISLEVCDARFMKTT